MLQSTLYIVATPIGNFKDITLRALEVLRSVDVIVAEDTRVTRKLLAHYEIEKKRLLSLHEHSQERAYREVLQTLEEGENAAVVTDAGTPAIADPGGKLVAFIRSRFPEAAIVPIPGPCALIVALSAAGVNADKFTFLGYPPHKKRRGVFFEAVKWCSARPVVLYESPHRLRKTFDELIRVCGGAQQVTVGRELTKLFETIFTGTLEEACNYFIGARARGEFVIVVR